MDTAAGGDGPRRRGRPRNQPVEEQALVCTGLVRSLLPYRDRFVSADCSGVHGNTQLQLGDVLLVLLCAFFNPTVRSQRLIEQLSQLNWARQHLHVEAVRRSTLSDAFRRFRPEQLHGLIGGLMRQVPQLRQAEGGDLEQVCRQILAADGSYWNVPADVAWALHQRRSNGKPQGQVRLNLQLDVRNWMPAQLSVSGQEEGSEAAAFLDELQSGVVYLIDRNFVHFGFVNAVLDKDSDLVLRLRKSDSFAVQQTLNLSVQDRQEGVLSDRLGVLPGSSQKRGKSRTTPPPQRMLRLLELRDPDGGSEEPLRILTSLLELPAALISQLYRQRWQIELFFRWLKVWASFDHLLAHSRQGITLQFYVAVIACLLMHLATGRKPNRYSLFLLGQVAMGLATLEQILPMLDKIEREKQLERERRARKRAALAAQAPQAALPA